MAKVTYYISRTETITFHSESKSRVWVFLTTFWRWPLWALAWHLDRNLLKDELRKGGLKVKD